MVLSLKVQELGGGPLASLVAGNFIGDVPYSHLTFRERLNDPGSIEFTVAREDAHKWHPDGVVGTDPFLSVGMVEIAVYDGATCLWEGKLTGYNESRNDAEITFLGEGVMAYLDDQTVTTIDFTGRKSNEILKDIIDDFVVEAGGTDVSNFDLTLLVTGETHAGAGVDWDVWGAAYFETVATDYKTHLTIVKDFLGYRGGMDFYIVPGTRVATPVFPPIGYSAEERDRILTDDNTLEWSRGVDGKEQAGEIVVIARPDAILTEVTITSNDATTLYPPRKKVFRRMNLTSTAAVTLEAESIAAEHGIPKSTFSFVLPADPWGDGSIPVVGEPIVSRVGLGFDSVEQQLRVYGMDTSEDDGIRTYTLYAEIANDFLGIV